MTIRAGRYAAEAIGHEFGISPNTGTQFIRLYFRLEAPGPENGQVLPYDGWLTDAAIENTCKALWNAGWDGQSLSDPQGIGSKKCELDVGNEENEEDGKTYARVNWVNKPRSLPDHMKLPPRLVASLDDRFLNPLKEKKAMARAESAGPAPDDDDIPF